MCILLHDGIIYWDKIERELPRTLRDCRIIKKICYTMQQQFIMILLLVSVMRADRWSHMAGDHGYQIRSRIGPDEQWPIECRIAERKCDADRQCFPDLPGFRRSCHVSRFTEESCDDCRLAAITISDTDAGFDYLKCKCDPSDRSCVRRKQQVDDCLAEMTW